MKILLKAINILYYLVHGFCVVMLGFMLSIWCYQAHLEFKHYDTLAYTLLMFASLCVIAFVGRTLFAFLLSD